MQQEDQEVQVTGYNITKTLGKGTFGKVRIATHIATQQKVAVKILQKQLIRDPSDVERISREIKILKKVYHPFIITLYEIVETQNRLYLFMEYASEGDLFGKICKERKLKQNIAATYFLQLLNGLKYLHQQGISHRDLKPENLLLQNNQIKIADFGLGNFFEPNAMLKTACGSPCYAAPEMISKLSYDPAKVDAWSSGVVLYAMIMGYLPFQDSNVHNLYNKIKKGEFKIPDWLSQPLKQLLRGVLNVNPIQRLSIDELINHPWIRIHHEANNIVPAIKLQPELVLIVATEHKLDKQKLTKALMTKKHNSLTTTYYLWMKKKSKSKTIDQKSASQKQQAKPVETSKQKIEESMVQSVQKKISKKQEESKQLTNTIETSATSTIQNSSIKKQQKPVQVNQNEKSQQSVVKQVDTSDFKAQTKPQPKQQKEQPKKTAQKQSKNVIIQQEIKVQFQVTKKKHPDKDKQKDKIPLRKVGRMQTQNMKKTATRLYERSGSRQTEVSIRLTAARKNKFLLKRVQKKPRLFNSQFFFEGHVEQLRDFVKKIQPNNLSIQVEYYEICPNYFYIVKTNMDTNNLRAGLVQRILKP